MEVMGSQAENAGFSFGLITLLPGSPSLPMEQKQLLSGALPTHKVRFDSELPLSVNQGVEVALQGEGACLAATIL